MSMVPAIGPEQERLFDRFRRSGTTLDPLDPPNFGTWNDDAPDELAELASLLHAADQASDRFCMVALGAAPGEWAVRAERAYRLGHPTGTFRSINLEGDLDHVAMTTDFMTRNGASMADNEVRYQVVASRDGFAYFPIINPDVDWGAGLAAVAETAEALDDNITMSETAKLDRISANDGKPLEFRTVPAVSLTTLLGESGEVDFLHCDIQGAESDVFPGHMAAMSAKVRICCIATHGREIERVLIEAFAQAGWTTEGAYPAYCIGEGEAERVLKDGVFLWSNPHLTTKQAALRKRFRWFGWGRATS
jgi:FkbM family methyltransferase